MNMDRFDLVCIIINRFIIQSSILGYIIRHRSLEHWFAVVLLTYIELSYSVLL